jgi:hypothetical protein
MKKVLTMVVGWLCICNTYAQQSVFQTAHLELELSNSGSIVKLVDRKTGKNHFASGQVSALLSLYADSVFHQPTAMKYVRAAGTITLQYKNGSVAVVKVQNEGEYLRFTLQSVHPRNNIQAIVWGPYTTTIGQSIGETVCVVHDGNFAIGMQALDINTIEGLPTGNDNAAGGSFIDPLPGQVLPDSLKGQIGKEVSVNVNVTGDMPEYVRMYRGLAAVKKNFGSQLQLFSRDRRIPRLVHNGLTNEPGTNLQYVQPIEVDFIGSSIALFGCPEPLVLDVLENIELKEKLPHPLLDGKWVKRSPVPGEAYLMYEGKDMDKGVELAGKFGFKLIHIGDLFQSWGHFGLNTGRYPGGAAEIKKVTDASWKKKTALGVHTLTMFTGTNDAYVSPVPSDSLAKAGTSKLMREINGSDDVIYIERPDFFHNNFGTHTVKIGKELINYRAVSSDQPWRLLDCRRGQYGTTKSAHPKSTLVDKLINNDYNGFYPDIHLQDDYAKRLAEVCNETGLGLMDFDGYGGESPTGHGAYGAARFADLWYKSLRKYVLTCGAGTFHYYWHIYSFMNWGEPWYNGLRESQVNYRIENQRYFERNYMPHMLGWFSVGADYRPEDIEWIQARSAAFNAGYLLRVDENLEKNGFQNEIFTAVREWQQARRIKAFTKDQIERFKNPKTEFHLSKTGENHWSLSPVILNAGYVHKFRRVQTGEPIADRFKINNPYNEQPIQFYATVLAVEGNKSATISNTTLDINNYQPLEINHALKAGDKLVCNGKEIYLCDANWNKVKTISTDKLPVFKSGENDVTVKSDFAGAESPKIMFEFKFVGTSETVGLNQ